jgi:hypothetical protein
MLIIFLFHQCSLQYTIIAYICFVFGESAVVVFLVSMRRVYDVDTHNSPNTKRIYIITVWPNKNNRSIVGIIDSSD